MTKIEMHITLEGEDAMRILRAIVAERDTEVKTKVVTHTTKEHKRAVLVPKEASDKIQARSPRDAPKGSNPALNGKTVKDRDMDLYSVYMENPTPPTAKEAATKTGISLNRTYQFTYTYNCKWSSGRARASQDGLKEIFYKSSNPPTCGQAAKQAKVTYASAHQWARRRGLTWKRAKHGRPKKGSK